MIDEEEPMPWREILFLAIVILRIPLAIFAVVLVGGLLIAWGLR